jgi:hypothetical protein
MTLPLGRTASIVVTALTDPSRIAGISDDSTVPAEEEERTPAS